MGLCERETFPMASDRDVVVTYVWRFERLCSRGLAKGVNPVLEPEVDALLCAAVNNVAIAALHSTSVQEAIDVMQVGASIR